MSYILYTTRVSEYWLKLESNTLLVNTPTCVGLLVSVVHKQNIVSTGQ